MKIALIIALLLLSIQSQINRQDCELQANTQIWYFGKCIAKTCINNRVAYLKSASQMNIQYAVTEASGLYKVSMHFFDPNQILNQANCLTYNIKQNSNPIPSSGQNIIFTAPTHPMTISPTSTRYAQQQQTFITFNYTLSDVERTCYYKDTGIESQMVWSCRFYFTFELQSQALLIFAFENLIQLNTAVDGSITKSVNFGEIASTTVCSSDSCIDKRNIDSALFFCNDATCDTESLFPSIPLTLNTFFYMVHKITTADFLTKFITNPTVIFESPDLKITLYKGDGAFPTATETTGKTIMKLRVPVYGNNVKIYVNGLIANNLDTRRIMNNRRILADPEVQNIASQEINAGNIAAYSNPTTTSTTPATNSTTPATMTSDNTVSTTPTSNTSTQSTATSTTNTATAQTAYQNLLNTTASESSSVLLFVSIALVLFLAMLI